MKKIIGVTLVALLSIVSVQIIRTMEARADLAYSPTVSGNLFAAVANTDNNTISIYHVNQSTGKLTEVMGSPYPTGTMPRSAAFSSMMQGNLYVAVTNTGDDTVSVYAVNASTGVLTMVAGSPFVVGSQPNWYTPDYK